MSALAQVLVVVKASPQPSRRYGDTVCVAGLEISDGPPQWRRLYPVPFRYLDGKSQFHKYDVLDVRLRDASPDQRPESRRIDVSGIRITGNVGTWQDRARVVGQLRDPTMCRLVRSARTDLNAQSLAAVTPRAVDGLDFEPHPGWSPSERAKLDEYRRQGDLFDQGSVRALEAPRLVVRLRYRCAEPACPGHTQRIIDWELTALQSRYRGRARPELERAITHNFLEIPFGEGRAPRIFVGNQEDPRRRAAFTVLGLYYPRTNDVWQQDGLF